MNNKRRKKISDVINNVNKYKILDEETEARDNIPESLQDSERYWESDQAVTDMEEVVDDMESIINDIDDVISTIDGSIKTINGSIKVNLVGVM